MNSTAVVILAVPLLCAGLMLVALVILASRTTIETGKKRESWQAFAQAISGAFAGGAAGQPDQVKAKIGAWPLYLDTYVVGGRQSLITYTRLRSFYPVRDAFEASICSKEGADELPAHSPLADLPVATLHLGADMIVKTNDEATLRALFANAEFAQLAQSLRPLDLQIRRRRNWQGGGVSNSVYEVHAQQRGVITDVERLKALHALVAACLQQLQQLGVAAHSFSEPH